MDISGLFGYVLSFIYGLVQNYGIAIIIFSILIKILLLPISVKQQKTMRITSKIQVEVKSLQKKYKKDPEKMNREIMDVYKREKVSPFGGCLSGIVQVVLLFAMFFLVRDPLTHMQKIDEGTLESYKQEIRAEKGDTAISQSYPEISIIKYAQEKDMKDQPIYLNMSFFGLDLSNVPQENLKNWTVYIIPLLYVVSSIISIKLSTSINAKNNNKKEDIIEINKEGEKPEEEEPDMMAQMNKNMMFMMPIMSVFIAAIAPLGLALYWLVNNILMIAERLILNKVLSSKEEEQNA